MEWYNVFNKGIPSERYMGFTLDLIGHNCSFDNEKYIKAVTSELIELNDRIKDETKLDVECRKGLFAVTLDDTLEQKLTFSPQIFIISLLSDLDVETTIEDEMREDKMLQMARQRLSDLHKIKISSQLEKEFPKLFEAYKYVEKMYNDKIEMRKKYAIGKKLGTLDEDAYNRNLAKYNQILGKYGFDKTSFNVKTFIENIYKRYAFILKTENYRKVTSVIRSSAIDMHKFDDCLDKDKFELVMACSCLSNAYLNPDDAISYISYLTQYFREHEEDMDSDLTVELNFIDEDKEFNRMTLYKAYKEYLINHPEVKIVRKSADDFKGQTVEDVMAYLKSFKGELEVSWDILPAGESLFERTRTGESSITDEERKQKEENKERILREKEKFFNDNKPYLVLKGKNSFLGYIGYIYPNAQVVLEKFYKNAKGTSIAEDAIYIMKVEEFLDLSIKSKPEIIEKHLCQRVTHHRGWQGKVEEFLKKEATEDTIERVQIFENQIRHLNK